MTGPADDFRPVPARKRVRDAAATRLALLTAAQGLFGQRGDERTTTRELGEAAGADRPTLRAQVAVAAVVGAALGRSFGWFDELATAGPDELAALVVEALGPRA